MTKLLIATGMHRSGTSLLAKLLLQKGNQFPGELLPANENNPEGYWENREVVKLNNKILSSMGYDWRYHGPLSAMELKKVTSDFALQAADILARLEQSVSEDFAIEDPRFCRVLPVWLRAAEFVGMYPVLLATVRHPDEVARSLFRRIRDERWRLAGIPNPTKSNLLWLRYNLNLECLSRGRPRVFVTFENLIQHRGDCIEAALNKLWRLDMDAPLAATAEAPDPYDLSSLSIRDLALTTFEAFQALINSPDRVISGAAGQELDARFECERSRFESPGHALDGAAVGIYDSDRIQGGRKSRPSTTPLRIAFVSGEPKSKGHIYRVENRIEALIGSEWSGIQADPGQTSVSDIVACCDLIVVFRMKMSPWLDALYELAASKRVPVVFDIDDLLFNPETMTPRHLAFLENAKPEKLAAWRQASHDYKSALQRADAVWVSTHELACHAARINSRVFTVPNGLSEDRLQTVASSLKKWRSQQTDQIVRIGYASGTPTHDRDFESVAHALADILKRFDFVHFSVVGYLDLEKFDMLRPFSKRIEKRKPVAFRKLPSEFARFDISIAPLELDNPFCRCKSELKYFEAALVKVPTVASATPPFVDAIEPEHTGYCASSQGEWRDKIGRLVLDGALRQRLGRAARDHAIASFGPEAQRYGFFHAAQDVISRGEK